MACKNDAVEESRISSLPYYTEASFTPDWAGPNVASAGTFHKIPEFALVNQLGEIVDQEVLKDKIYVVNFFFTSCPGICPKMMDNMKVIQDSFELDDEVILLSHSVNPSADSVSVLLNYADAKGVMPHKWHLLTGERKEIYDLGRHAYFIEENLGLEKSDEDFLHTENFVLIDKDKYIRGIYNGLNATSMQLLIADIKLLKEAS